MTSDADNRHAARLEAAAAAVRPSTITRTITGDKVGIIDSLREQRDYKEAQAHDASTTRRNRDRAAGYHDGLDYAIRMLQDWQQD